MKTLAILGYFNDEVLNFVKMIRARIGVTEKSKMEIPHITFIITGDLSIEKAQTITKKYLENNNLFLLEFSSLGFFPDSGVLFLGITPTIELFHFQSGLIKLISDEKCKISPYYMPGKWVPHCSVSTNRDFDSFWCSAIEDVFLPFPARIEKLSVTELDHSIGEMTHRIDFGQMIDPEDKI